MVSGNELTEITLPTGGTITYGYQTIVPGGCGSAHPSAFRGVVTRTIDDRSGSGGQEWTYSWINGSTRVLTITDPMNNVSVHTNSNFAYTSTPYVCNWKETKVQEYNGQSTLLKTTTTNYTNTAPASILPTQTTVTWGNNQTYHNTTSYDLPLSDYRYSNKNGGQINQMPNGYVNANPYQVIDYDYTASPLRTTTTHYQAFGPNDTFPNDTCQNSYCSANLLNLVSTVATSGTSNSATTTNIYDEGGGIQGNLTSIDHLLNGNNIKTEGRAYNANGTISIRADAYGAPTNYAYDSSGLFLSTSTNALNQITTYEYDDNTGLLNWVKDANPSGNVTSYTYDSVNRVTAINYPDQGSVSFDYNDTTPSPSVMITRAITASQNESQTAIVD